MNNAKWGGGGKNEINWKQMRLFFVRVETEIDTENVFEDMEIGEWQILFVCFCFVFFLFPI